MSVGPLVSDLPFSLYFFNASQNPPGFSSGFVGYPNSPKPYRDSQLTNTIFGNEYFDALSAWTSPTRVFKNGLGNVCADCYAVISINNTLNRTVPGFFYNSVFTGAGYSPGDTGTIHGGNAGDATYEVTAVGVLDGSVAAFEITGSGSAGYAPGLAATTSTDGDGSGFVMLITGVFGPGDIYQATLVPSSQPYMKFSLTVNDDNLFVMCATVTSLQGFSFNGNNLGLIVQDLNSNQAELFQIESMSQSSANPGFNIRTDYPATPLFAPNVYSPTLTLPFIDVSNFASVNPQRVGTQSLMFNQL